MCGISFPAYISASHDRIGLLDVRCNICRAACHAFYENMYDDRYGFPGKYLLVRCPECDHKQLQFSASPELLTKLYTEYYPRSGFNLEDHKPLGEASGFMMWLGGEYASAFRWVPKNVRVLDIGCGFGETLGYHESRGCVAYGVEIDENIARVAKRNGYNVRVGPFFPGNYDSDSFDYVTLDQVIEHISSPADILLGIRQVLKPGGRAIVSTPNSNGWGADFFKRRWINWHAPYHLNFFSIRSMKMAAELAGLVLEKVNTVTNSKWLHYQWIHCLTFPDERSPSVFWTKKGERTLMINIAIVALSLLHFTGLNHVVTRILDGTGKGDNHLFFLRRRPA